MLKFGPARINRRAALALIGSSGALGAPGIALGKSAPPPVRFGHGVASGDPAADGAVIWTRATTPPGYAGDVELQWQVAASPQGAPVAQGQITARAAADHTAKIEVSGLEPGREYHYRFVAADGTASPPGRFRTLPVGDVGEVVLGVVSCQLWAGGFFNAYADLARRERLDAVVHLGDYIYEYGSQGFGAEVGAQIGRLPDPPHEIVTLADYRRRHAQVKTDPDLQAAHARAAFICAWDDHETTNDSWFGGAENHDEATQGDWAARKAVAMQAYFEWMPIREPHPFRAREAICRSFEFGNLATLGIVETRLIARARQLAPKGGVPPQEALATLFADLDQPGREMLGKEQKDWLEGVFAASVQAGKPWQVLGNQVVMARVAGPDLEAQLGAGGFAELSARLPEQYRAQIMAAMAAYRAGVPFNLDAWDGYPHAREQLYRMFARAGTRPIVLSGDSHASWTNNLADQQGRLAAVEVGCTAISSPSYGAILPGLGRLLAAANQEVAFCDQDHKGYSLLTLTAQQARAEHWAVSSVTSKDFTSRVLAAHVTAPGIDGGPFAPA